MNNYISQKWVDVNMFSLCFKATPVDTFATEATTERQR